MADGPSLQISIGGSPLAIIDGKVYALLMPGADEPANWTASSGPVIVFTDQSSGRNLIVPSTDTGTQAAAMPPTVFNAVLAWQVAKLDGNGDPAPVTEVTESGYYTLQAVGTDQFLSRNQVEDYSIRPKAVVLQGSDNRWGPAVIQVT